MKNQNKIETTSDTRETEWYRDGLCFECTLSGNCCTGPAGTVWVDDRESLAIARHLNVKIERFLTRYTRLLFGRCSLTEILTEHGYDCVFLDRKTKPGKAVCRIYEVRPKQCRTWPFWPENLKSPEDWEQIGTLCPGVDRGGKHSLQSIRIQRDETPA